MTIYIEKERELLKDTVALGFDKHLVKKDPNADAISLIVPELRNIFSEGISPDSIISGELAAALEQVQQALKSGKSAFSTAQSGYILGVDSTDGLAKFYLGNSTNYMYFDGTTLQVTGGAVIGSVGGFIITATALTGGALVLDSAANRISWGSANDILIADADDATYRLWAGNATAASAPFSVTKTGVVVVGQITATSIIIGANTVTTSEWAFLDGLNQTVATTSSPTFVNLSITSFASNWTNAGRTVADMGILTTVDINGGTLDAVIIGGASAAAATFTTVSGTAITGTSFIIGANTLTTSEWANLDGINQTVATTSSPTFVNLSITSFASNWTNAGRTVADMGILTTVDINGGSVDGATIGAASPSSGVFTSLRADTITNDTGLAAGVYTPTRSSETNLDANVTMTEAQYLRVGNTVTVSGRFTADPTLTATVTNFEIDLPVASNIGAAEDLAGVAFCGSIAAMGAEIIGVVANDTAQIQWISSDVTSQSWSYTFTYQVI